MPRRRGRGRGGGVLQRRGRGNNIAAIVPAPALPERHGGLCEYLLELVAWKYISPQEMQKMAMHATTDIISTVKACMRANDSDAEGIARQMNPTLFKLASFGTSGTYSSNVHRELMTFMGAPTIPLSSMVIPLKLPGKSMPVLVEQKVIWPHRLLNTIFNSGGNTWRLRVCPGPDRLEEFWNNVAAHPNYVRITCIP
jgi:hypothetical protein